MVFMKSYSAPPFNDREILRYAGCKSETADVRALLEQCKAEAAPKLSYKICYLPLSVQIRGAECDFGALRIVSRDLAEHLAGCFEVIIFAATVGIGIERLIAKYSRLSPSKALMLDAIGTERTESLCDLFCSQMEQTCNKHATPRFSPGYGDFLLSFQKEIFSLLDPKKHIGLTLTDSLLMSPSKSVTAVMGLRDTACEKPFHKCNACQKQDCPFRSAL